MTLINLQKGQLQKLTKRGTNMEEAFKKKLEAFLETLDASELKELESVLQ